MLSQKIKLVFSQKTQQMQRVSIIITAFILLTISSCVPKKNIVYFQNDDINQSLANNNYKIIFKPNDLVTITISALNAEAAKPFNLNSTKNNSSEVAQPQSYLIDSNGNIEFPILGKIKLAGKTKIEAISILKSKLDPDYIKNPTINIKISNFSITVLGDVKNPGKFLIPNEKVSIIEAIGLAGDLNISGIRNLEVKRIQENIVKTYNLDLRSNKIFTSPAYYLQQNDIVYIKPNKAASQSASYNQNTGLFISLGSVIISLITLIIAK